MRRLSANAQLLRSGAHRLDAREPRSDLDAGAELKLSEDALYMPLDGALADRELLSDLKVGQASSDQRRDLALAGSEANGPISSARRRLPIARGKVETSRRAMSWLVRSLTAWGCTPRTGSSRFWQRSRQQTL